MAIDRTPVLKRCRQLGIDPAELGYSSKKESIRQPKRRRKESEYGMQLREKQKVHLWRSGEAVPRLLQQGPQDERRHR
jgi:ribosomal protein S4